MNQADVLKMIAVAFGGFAALGISVSLSSLVLLRRKTQDEHRARLAREASHQHGHPCT